MSLHKSFISGIEELGYTYEEIVKWKYAGGNSGSHRNYYYMLFGSRTGLPEHRNKCVCGHYIKENCYIVAPDDPDGLKLLVIGNCCIKKFIPNCGRTCEDCGSIHRNRKDNKCNDCREPKIPPKPKKGTCRFCKDKCGDTYTQCYKCYIKYVKR